MINRHYNHLLSPIWVRALAIKTNIQRTVLSGSLCTAFAAKNPEIQYDFAKLNPAQCVSVKVVFLIIYSLVDNKTFRGRIGTHSKLESPELKLVVSRCQYFDMYRFTTPKVYVTLRLEARSNSYIFCVYYEKINFDQ